MRAHPSHRPSLRACYVMTEFDFSVNHWLRKWPIKSNRRKLLSTLNRSNVRISDSRPALAEKAFLNHLTILLNGGDLYGLNGKSRGQKDEKQNNVLSPKKQCSFRLQGSIENNTFAEQQQPLDNCNHNFHFILLLITRLYRIT